MQLKDIKTLKEVSEQYNIPVRTLQDRLRWLEKDIDYKSMGKRQSAILTPLGVQKITRGVKKDDKVQLPNSQGNRNSY